MTINYNGTIKSLRDIVWGVVTDPLSQIEQITLLIFIKLLSERHNELERLKAKKLIFTGEYASYHFDSLSRLSGYELVDTTRKAVESLYKNPNIDEPIRRLYERSYLQVNDPRVLSLLINEINKIDIAHIDMGDFYEHLLAALGTQKEAGQFRTPRHLIEFIVDIVDPQIGERVLDPACGTAGFLTAAYTHIRDENTSQEARKTDAYLDKLNFDQKTFLLNKTIFGFDIDPKMIKFAISNLYLHNIKNPNISQHNTLTSNDSWEEKYEVILTNPPFSTPKGGVKPTDRFTLDSKRTEVLFVEYVIEHLTLNGRAGVIVPEGIIFQSGKAYKELRKWLIENNYLYAVVSLPSGVFNPYSGVKTSILFLDRERAQKSDKILFCKVENDGFDLGAQRRSIDNNDLPEVLRVVKEYQANPNKPIDSTLAYTVIKDKIIQSGDHNLSGDRYKETISFTNQKWPMVQLDEIARISSGDSAPQKKSFFENGKYNFFRTSDVGSVHISGNLIKSRDKLNDKGIRGLKLFPKGTILLPKSGASTYLNHRAMLGVEGYVSSHLATIIADRNKIIPKFLFYLFLKIDSKKLTNNQNYPSLKISEIAKITIPLPQLSIQQQIVDELDGYQKIIDGAKQVVDNYKPQIKIDPKWESKKLECIAEVTSSKRVFKSEYVQEGIPFYRTKEVVELNQNKPISLELFISEKHFNEIEGKFGVPKKGDILISAVGTIGISWVIPDERKFYFKDGNLLWIKNLEGVDPYYLKAVLDDIFTNSSSQLSFGAAYKALTIIKLKQVLIPIPFTKIQQQIVTRIEEEQKLVEANKKLIQLFEQKIKDKIAEVWGKNK